MMREIHGVVDAKKICMAGAPEDTSVTVAEGPAGTVDISIGSQSYAARMTTEQALFLASHLAALAEQGKKK